MGQFGKVKEGVLFTLPTGKGGLHIAPTVEHVRVRVLPASADIAFYYHETASRHPGSPSQHSAGQQPSKRYNPIDTCIDHVSMMHARTQTAFIPQDSRTMPLCLEKKLSCIWSC